MIRVDTEKRDNILSDLLPDLTPLLDVMFMLIVFLILTANTVPFAIDLTLPEDRDEVARALEDTDTIAVSLLPGDGGWKIGDEVFDMEEPFREALAGRHRAAPHSSVVIFGDRAVSMEKLINLLTFLKKENIQAADIVLERQ